MKLSVTFAALFAAAALAAAAPASAQRDRYYDDERYEDSRYDDERDRYEDYDEYQAYGSREPEYDYARVVSVDPIIDVASRPVQREECRQLPVRRESGPAISQGIIGSVLAQPSTTGRTAAVAGASHTATTRRCTKRTEYVQEERITGYDVAYRYRGRTYYTVTSSDPGDRVRVRLD